MVQGYICMCIYLGIETMAMSLLMIVYVLHWYICACWSVCGCCVYVVCFSFIYLFFGNSSVHMGKLYWQVLICLLTFLWGTGGFIAACRSSVYLGKLLEQVRIWLVTFLDGTCVIQMSFVSFDNATLDYILVIWVCMVRLPPSFLNIFQVPKVS